MHACMSKAPTCTVRDSLHPNHQANADADGRLRRGAQLWYHVVGTPQARDRFVYAVPEEPEWKMDLGFLSLQPYIT